MSPLQRKEEAAAAIRHHYDVGNPFYSLWLDDTLTYSCAIWDGPSDTLESAQKRKLDFHLNAVGVSNNKKILDIGCGWGAILKQASENHDNCVCVGLTLSNEQEKYIQSLELPNVDVKVESWLEYEPANKFDGIISIGAFEHFATPMDSSKQKIELYKHFFTKCRGWLNEDGMLSLQTIAYANMDKSQASDFINKDIFPNADLPTLAEITAAAEGLFEIQHVSNGRIDYALTCEEWGRRLKKKREIANNVAGSEIVNRYERYLKLSAMGFRMGKICLLRLILKPYKSKWF